jgi:Recombinase
MVEKEADVICFIFQLCSEGYSLERIQDLLNILGYASPVNVKGYGHRRKSNQWAKSSIRRILTKSLYMGEYDRWTLTHG